MNITPPLVGPKELRVIELAPTKAGITQGGEKHEYVFGAAAAGTYTIKTVGRTDLVMALYGPDSNTDLKVLDDDSGMGWNAKIVADLTLGMYKVGIALLQFNDSLDEFP